MLLAPRDAANMLGRSVSRLQQLEREGRITCLRDSAGRRLFRARDLIKFREREQLAAERRREAACKP